MKSKRPHFEKHARNGTCHCGSGLKYKKCCWIKKLEKNAADVAAWKKYCEESAAAAQKRREAALDNLKELPKHRVHADSFSPILMAVACALSSSGRSYLSPRARPYSR